MWGWARDACSASLRRLLRVRVLALSGVTPRWFLRARGMSADVGVGSRRLLRFATPAASRASAGAVGCDPAVVLAGARDVRGCGGELATPAPLRYAGCFACECWRCRV